MHKSLSRREFLCVSGTVALLSAGPSALLACGRHASEPTTSSIDTPVGFTWLDHPLAGRLSIDRAGEVRSSLDVKRLRPSAGTTYYVDLACGDDTDAGTAEVRPLRSLAAACARTDARTIMVRGYGPNRPYFRTLGFSSQTQDKALNVVGYGDQRPYITTHDPLTFRRVDGMANTFEAGRASVVACVDVANGAPGVRLSRVDQVHNCDSLAGSWCQQGSRFFVHAPDSRDLTSGDSSQIWALLNVPNFKNVGDHCSYLENLAFYGGVDCVNVSGATPAGSTLLMVDVITAMSDPASGNNVSAWGAESLLSGCEARWSGKDGFNYHALNGCKPRAVEVDCRAIECGTSPSDQCSTAHDGAKIIRVGGIYRTATAANVADVNGTGSATESWNIGCTAELAGPSFANWQCGSEADSGTPPKMWLQNCAAHGSEFSTASYAGGEIWARSSDLTRNRSPIAEF